MLWLEYTTNEIGGDDLDPSDEWSSRTDRYRNPKIQSLKKDKATTWEYESLEVGPEIHSSDEFYFVVVKYYDGNTFGRTYGYLCLDSASLDKETAITRAQNIYKGIDSNSIYEPWNGYFSGLEEVSVYVYKHGVIQEIQSY